MKNLKSFAERHILTIAFLGASILGLAGSILSTLFNYFWLLAAIFLAVLLYFSLFYRSMNTDWTCSKCGADEIIGRHKFCSTCGGIMHTVKKKKISCPRGHRASKYDTFCHKCGVRI